MAAAAGSIPGELEPLESKNFYDPVKRVLIKKYAVPPTEHRRTAHIICVIDVSGSMGTAVSSTGDAKNFSRLDLVKHSLNTIISSLSATDMFTLITFSDDALVLAKHQLMNDANRASSLATVKGLYPQSSTNLWDGLRAGYENATTPAYNTNIILLTDGIPSGNLDTPGILRAQEHHGNPHHIPVYTMGFGSELDLHLLVELAGRNFGTFLHIPDISMIGTVFVNCMANILSRNQSISGLHLRYGDVHYLISKVDVCKEPATSMTFEHEPALYGAYISWQFADVLSKAIEAGNAHNFPKAQTLVQTFKAELEHNAVDTPQKVAILDDIEHAELHKGQVTKALTAATYGPWGLYYLTMLRMALINQQRCNFKDASVQSYGGPLFAKLADTIDDLYTHLPPPAASLDYSGSGATINIAAYNYSGGGCFTGDGIIEGRRVDSLHKGDIVNGHMIRCVTQYEVNNTFMIKLNGFMITAWHPVNINGKWCFPCTLGLPSSYFTGVVYDFVLDGGYSVMINGLEVLTLAHGLHDEIASHPYLGTEKVIEDLKKLPGWEKGVVHVHNYKRNSEGLIDGVF